MILKGMKNAYGALAVHASQQHGLFRQSEIERCGVSRQELRSLVDSGWCVLVARGLYRVVASPRTADQALLEQVLRHPAPAFASHRAAARLWGLPGFEHGPPEITIRQALSRRGGPGRTRGTLVLPPNHVTVRRGIPTMTVSRTIFDLAGILRFARVEQALDTALSRRLCTTASLRQVFFVLGGRGRKGTVAVRRLLEDRGEGYVPPASELEARARRLIREAGLPEPEFEVDLGDEDWIGRVDCLWRSAKLILELDGRRYHDSLTARSADRTRDNRMMAEGWRVIRVTWEDIVHRPADVVALLWRALGEPVPPPG